MSQKKDILKFLRILFLDRKNRKENKLWNDLAVREIIFLKMKSILYLYMLVCRRKQKGGKSRYFRVRYVPNFSVTETEYSILNPFADS